MIMKQILISLILLSSILTVNAQTWTGSSDINGNLWRNGNVGIGTTAPDGKLQISHNSTYGLATNDQLIIKPIFAGGTTTNPTSYGSIIWTGSDGIMGRINIVQDNPAATTASHMEFWTNGAGISEKMRITNGGNVGIGTTNPAASLHVVGSGSVIARFNDTATNGGAISYQRSGTAILDIGTGLGLLGIGSNNDAAIYATSHMYIGADGNNVMTLNNGNVGIGTTTPAYKLDVCGTIRAKEVKVDLQGNCGADFVFKSDYKLMGLKELETYVKTNQHLPEIASEKEMVENGVNIKDLQMKLLQKMEEMTLYVIEQNKQIIEQSKRIEKLENENIELKKK
jgi:hypothetical protein